jgi:hypothetical protein
MSAENIKRLYSRRGLAQAAGLGGMLPALAAGAQGGPAPAPAGTFLDVRGFGAKGDGKSDDTKAIQSAIDAAAGGGAVFLSPGIYRTAELQMRPKTSIVGVAAWDYGSSGGSVLRLLDENATCLLNITGAFGVTIDGLSLEGGRLGKGVHGIFLNKKEYAREDAFRIERSRVASFSGDGVRLIRAWCYTIRHCMMGRNAGDGVYMRGWDGFLLDNWFSGNQGAGFAAREENASCTFTGNRIEWNRAGIELVGGDSYNITGNFFDRSGTSALILRKGPQGPVAMVTVTGNVVRRSGKSANADSYDSAQVMLDGCRGVVFTGNTLQAGRDDNGRGAWSPSYGIAYKDLQHCVVSGNALHNGALKQLMVDLGGNDESVVVKDNPGGLFQPPAPAPPA